MDSKCTLCGLHKTTKRVKIDSVVGEKKISEYKEPIEMAFIAEAPGEKEEEYGIPLIGPAGMNLNTALKEANIERSKVLISNICRCRPPNNRTPTKKEQGACYPYLIKELKQVQPKVIVCLGLAATKTILNNTTIRMGDAHGRAYSGKPVLGFDCIIVPTWHPSPTTFINNDDRRFQMIADIIAAKGHLEGGTLSDKKDWLSITVSNYETWCLILPLLQEANHLTIDVETTGLDIHAKDAEITNIGITSHGNYGISVVCREGDWVRTDKDGNVFNKFKDFLTDLETLVSLTPTVAHNMCFDAKYMKKVWNIWPKKWLWDTMLGHSLIRPGSSAKLKDISWQYTPKMGGYEHELQEVGGLMVANAYERVDYNVADIVCTDRIYNKQLDALTKEKKLFLMQKILMPAAEIFAEMEYIGIPVDIYTLNELEKDYRKRLLDKKSKIYMHGSVMEYNKAHGSFNPSSPDQVGTLLFDKRYCGYPVIEKSAKTKKPSCSKKILTELQRTYKSEIVAMILDYRATSKLHSTYLKGMGQKLVNGRVHTHYHLNVARSGRTSSCVAKGTMIDVVRDLSKYPVGIPIEDVKVGDHVYCYDNNCKLTIKKVKWAGKTGTKPVLKLEWESAGKHFNGKLKVTPEHRIRLADGSYMEARELAGKRTKVLALSRDFTTRDRSENPIDNFVPNNHQIIDVVDEGEVVDVYNLEVEDFHNFIANGICVKNSNPNLQNISGDSDIKSMFVPDTGYKFIDLDYRQMELVVSAYYTNDQVMVEAVQSGDAHTHLAKLIFGMTDVSEENRRFVKTLNFGVIYGMGAGKLAEALDIDIEEAKKFIKEYFDILKATKIWIDGRRRQAEEKGFVTSKFGRIRYYKKKEEALPGEKIEYNSAVNHPIQSLASDLMLYAMVQWKNHLVKRGLYYHDAYMALQVHDSIISCVREELVEELVREKKAVFESTKFEFMTLPLTVEIKTGHNWGNLMKIL